MHEVVQPVVPVPYFMEDNVRFTHVAVDVVQGKDMLFHIIYLTTGRFLMWLLSGHEIWKLHLHKLAAVYFYKLNILQYYIHAIYVLV